MEGKVSKMERAVSNTDGSHLNVRVDREAFLSERSRARKKELFVELLRESMCGNAQRVGFLLRQLSWTDASQLDFRRNQPSFGETPLHRACTAQVAKMLLDHGVPVDVKGTVEQTPLHTVRNASVAALLLERGAQIDALTKDGSTPLHWAVVLDNLDVVRVLVDAGANVNAQNANGNSPLHMVSSIGVARYLVSHGSRLDIQNKAGKIPLEVAAEKGEDEMQLQVATFLLDESHNIAVRGPSVSDDLLVDVDMDLDEEDELETSMREHHHENGGGEYHHRFRHYDSLERSRAVVKKTDARDRWRKVRAKVVLGSFKTDAESKRVSPEQRRLRFSSLADIAREASFASTWSDDEAAEDESKEFYSSFFELMVRDRPKLALKMLDKQRAFLYAKGNDKIYSYDTSLLGGPTDYGRALTLIVSDQRYELITHEIVQWVLNIRWILFTRECLLFEFFMHALFILIYTATTLFGKENLLDCFKGFLAVLADPRNQYPLHVAHVNQVVFEVALFILNLRHLARHFMERKVEQRVNGYGLLASHPVESAFDLLPNLFVLFQQVMRTGYEQDEGFAIRIANSTSALASVILWIRLLSFAEGFESIGVAMSTIRRMIVDIIIYLFVLLIFITGFSHAITLVFKGAPPDSPFIMMYNTWITLFFFVFNLDVSALDAEPSYYRRYLGYALVGAYMIVVALVILNLIIAIMTNAFDEIQQNAKEQWLLQRAKIILRYDNIDLALDQLSEAFSFPKFFPKVFRRHDTSLSRHQTFSHPSLPHKNIATEKPNGAVILQVPTDWLHALNATRRQDPHFRWFRYWCFRSWKRLRKSPSFLWPSMEESEDFFIRQHNLEEQTYQNVFADSMHLKSLGDDLSVLDTGKKAISQEEAASTLMSSSQSSYGTTTRAAPRAASLDAIPPPPSRALRQRHQSQTVKSQLQHYTSVENAAMRTGSDEELMELGKFYRDPKRIAAERTAQAEKVWEQFTGVKSPSNKTSSSAPSPESPRRHPAEEVHPAMNGSLQPASPSSQSEPTEQENRQLLRRYKSRSTGPSAVEDPPSNVIAMAMMKNEDVNTEFREEMRRQVQEMRAQNDRIYELLETLVKRMESIELCVNDNKDKQ